MGNRIYIMIFLVILLWDKIEIMVIIYTRTRGNIYENSPFIHI
jgi:hypothetical protein